MGASQVAEASDFNAIEALRHFMITSGGQLIESDGALFAASPDPYCGTYHNAVTRTDRAADPARVLRKAFDFFAGLDRRFILWATAGFDADLEAAARDYGLLLRSPGTGSPGMVCDRPVPDMAAPTNVQLRQVTKPEHVQTFADIVGEAYSARGESTGSTTFITAARAMFGRPSSVLSPNTHGAMAYLEGEPVACAMGFHTGRTAGLYWVSTVKAARNRGLGAFVTTSVVNECFRRGATNVVLQASEMGAGIYERMGFTRVTCHRRYIGDLRTVRHAGVGAHTSQMMHTADESVR